MILNIDAFNGYCRCVTGLNEAKALIKSIITKEHTVPSFLRLAIHDAFCFDAQNNVYGANASIRCILFSTSHST